VRKAVAQESRMKIKVKPFAGGKVKASRAEAKIKGGTVVLRDKKRRRSENNAQSVRWLCYKIRLSLVL
jgi:hypothetical protein